MIRRLFAALVIALCAIAAHAEGLKPKTEWIVGAHLYTKHPEPGMEGRDSYWAGQRKLWNDKTYGLYAAKTVARDLSDRWSGDVRVIGGVYCNSFSRPERNVAPNGLRSNNPQSKCNVTKYLGAQYEEAIGAGFHWSASLAVIHGYNSNMKTLRVGGARLLIAPIPSISWGPVRVSMLGPGEVHVSAEHRF